MLIVIESHYGTNRKVAEAVAAGLGEAATVTIVDAADAPTSVGAEVDLLLVGGPNHKANLPTPETRAEATRRQAASRQTPAGQAADGQAADGDAVGGRGLREWLDDLQLARDRQPAAVWDTRMASPRILDAFDHSARTIGKRLRRAGARLVDQPRKYYSADGKGALVDGEEGRARAWGAELAHLELRT